MEMDLILAIGAMVLGWVILGCVCSYAFPQFIRTIKTKNTSSMSVVAYVAFIICAALMASWGIGNGFRSIEYHPEWTKWSVLSLVPNILTNIINVTLNLICLITKINHLRLCKKYNINEIELAKRLLKAKHKGGK